MAEPPEDVLEERRWELQNGMVPNNLKLWAKSNDAAWAKYLDTRFKSVQGLKGAVGRKNKILGTNPYTERRIAAKKKPELVEAIKSQDKGKTGIFGSVSRFLSGAAANASKAVKAVAAKVLNRMPATKAAKASTEAASKRTGFGRK
jgi:hypothetical protein